MKWKFKQFMLKFLIMVLAIYISVITVKAYTHQPETIRIIKPNEQVTAKKYIISEEAIMSKLKSKSQIVSLEQSLDKKDVYVDDNFFGERRTELKVHGTYKLGLETSNIKVLHIDNTNGIIFLHIGKPNLISLDIPYDHIKFQKTQGFLRLSASEDEQKKFYKVAEKNIEHELMSNKILMKQADMFNKNSVMQLLKLIPEIKTVVFQ